MISSLCTIDTILLAISLTTHISLLIRGWNLRSIADNQSQTLRINVPVTPDESKREYRLRHEIEAAVEHGFIVRRNDISTLAQAPSDGIEKPDEQCQDTA